MTVTLVTAIHRFVGISTDSKPDDAPIGSTFYEWDTKATFVWDGAQWWQQ